MPACASTLAGFFNDGALVPVGSGNPGGAASGNPGGAASGNPGGAASGNPGGAASGNPGGAASGNPGGAASGNPGGAASGNPGGAASGNPGGAGNRKWQPLGELVSVDMELAGLQGQPVLLSWSIFQKDGPSHLSAKWIGNFVAYRLDATTNDDTGTLEMWIPLPKQHGPYFVRLTLTTTGGASLASMDSGLFD